MTTPLQRIKRKLSALWQIADETARGKAVETVEHEVEELTHIFALLVLGVFVGLPAPPAQITLELMPDLEPEFDLMLSKVTTAHDPLGELFSVLGID
jgi:hypothetical protein